MKNEALEEKAAAYAFLLLKFRLRSVREMRQRLAKKKFAPGIIDKLIGRLEEKKFLDDREFTRAWIASRAARNLGPARIRTELRLKGIAPELIAEGLGELKDARPEVDDIRRICREKFEKLRNLDPRTAKRRLYAYFLRRGFSPEIVNEEISQLE